MVQQRMSKSGALWCLVLAGILLGQGVALAQTQTAQELYEGTINRVSSGIVLIIVSDSSGDVWSGSGAVISPNGCILTCAHLLPEGSGGAIKVFVPQSDSRVAGQMLTARPATVEAVHEYWKPSADLSGDIAILKIEAEDLPYIPIGDSTAVGYGEQVIALGYPLVTGRVVGEEINLSQYGLIATPGQVVGFRTGEGVRFIQHTAMLEPGNSGGPLINDEGEVIGINVSTIGDITTSFLSVATESCRDVIQVCGTSVRTWHPVSQSPAHSSEVLSCAFASTGGWLVSSTRDSGVWQWHLDTGTTGDAAPAISFAEEGPRSLEAGFGPVWDTVVSPDARWIVAGGADSVVRVWDAVWQKPAASLVGHSQAVFSVAVSPDGRLLASASGDGSVRLWSTDTWQLLHRLSVCNGPVNAVAFSPSGGAIASGSTDGMVIIWEASTGQRLTELRAHTAAVTSLAFYPDGGHIVSGAANGGVRVADLTTSKVTRTIAFRAGAINDMAIDPGGTTLALATEEGGVRIYDLLRAREIALAPGDYVTGAHVRSVAFSNDGQYLVSASGGLVTVWARGAESGT